MDVIQPALHEVDAPCHRLRHMHHALLTTLMMLSTQSASPAADAIPRWGERCPRDVVRAFVEVERSLRDLGDDIDAVDDRRQRRRLREDLDRTIRLTERARDAACDAARGTPPPVIVAPPPPPPPQPVVLSPAAFAELRGAVEREAFDDGKKRVIGLAYAGDVCATVDQVKQLMGLHSFSSAQVDLVKTLAPRLVDPERAFTLQDGLTFSTDKERLAKALKSSPQLPVCRVP